MLLELSNIRKTFGGVVALDDVSFDLLPGEVHVLLGENGAGKSTFINIVTGAFARSAGTLRIAGETVTELSPHSARERGIAAVFQEFSLVPELTVTENLFLGAELRGSFFLRQREMREAAKALFDKIGFSVPIDKRVLELTRAQKQMVEIAKSLRDEIRVLILDEPTASLTDGEAEKLFEILETLKSEGIGIIYVSHRMPEIRRLADRVTVLRGGRHIGTVRKDDVSDDQLIEMMVGQKVDDLYPAVTQTPGLVRLKASGITSRSRAVQNASIELRAGEIVGLAGLVGCGRSELCRAIFGLDRITGGAVEIDGRVFSHPSPRRLLKAGLCYFPADRHHEGLALGRPARENATMAALDVPPQVRNGLINPRVERRLLETPLQRLGLRPMRPEARTASFSGGNQQKIMLARGLMRPLDIYVFDEPTVGIDVGAKADVYRLMKSLVEAGAAVLLSSSELPELVHLSNRVYVMRESRIVAELGGPEVTETRILGHYFNTEETKEGNAA